MMSLRLNVFCEGCGSDSVSSSCEATITIRQSAGSSCLGTNCPPKRVEHIARALYAILTVSIIFAS